jgi:hypothetical protein
MNMVRNTACASGNGAAFILNASIESVVPQNLNQDGKDTVNADLCTGLQNLQEEFSEQNSTRNHAGD